MSIVEIAGFLSSLLAVWLTIKKSKWCWLWNIVSSAIYAIFFFEIKLFADTILQFFFIGMSIYGWFIWNSNSETSLQSWKSLKMNFKLWLVIIFSVLLTTIFSGYFLSNYTLAVLPYLDSFCFALSITATALAARKYLENWLIWILADIIYVGIYINKNSFLTACLYTLFVFLAINGFLKWKKSLQMQS